MRITKKDIKEMLVLFIPFIKKPIESKIITVFINTGHVLIIGALLRKWYEPLAVSVAGKWFGVSPDNSLDVVIGIQIGVGFICWILAIVFYYLTIYKKKNKKKKEIAILHQSIEKSVDVNIADDDAEMLMIDLRSELSDKSLYGVRRAFDTQCERVIYLQSIIEKNEYKRIKYCGLVSIPFAMYLGHTISDKLELEFSEWNETDKKWYALTDSDKYPEVIISSQKQITKCDNVGDLVIRVNFTRKIDDIDIENINLDVLNVIDFGVKEPKRGIITSKMQLLDYQVKFRELLDEIDSSYKKLGTIHIFIAAQTSLVYTLGSKINDRMDTDVVIYQYERKGDLRYPWGLKLNKELKRSEDIVIEVEKGKLHVQN